MSIYGQQFFALPPEQTGKWLLLLTGEHVAYGCPQDKHSFLKSMPVLHKVCPCDFMYRRVILYMGILEINTVFPLPQPLKKVASIRCCVTDITFSHLLWDFRFLISKIRKLNFKTDMCAGSPGIDKLFRN